MSDIHRHAENAFRATEHIAPTVDAVQLYEEAARAAEERIGGPLGAAIAGVLVMAAYQRRTARLGGNVGEFRTLVALAVAVLEHIPTENGRR